MVVGVERARRRFTIEEYERMVETGILTQDDRVELIEGEIVEISRTSRSCARARTCVGERRRRTPCWSSRSRTPRCSTIAR